MRSWRGPTFVCSGGVMKWISVVMLWLACTSGTAHADAGSHVFDEVQSLAAQSDQDASPGAFEMGATTMVGYLALRGIRRRLHFHIPRDAS